MTTQSHEQVLFQATLNWHVIGSSAQSLTNGLSNEITKCIEDHFGSMQSFRMTKIADKVTLQFLIQSVESMFEHFESDVQALELSIRSMLERSGIMVNSADVQTKLFGAWHV